MAKINNFDYPELSFSEAIKMIKRFHERLNGKASSFSSLATAFESSEKSGWFKVKIGDLRKYNLIEGRGEVKISDIGQDILFYNKKEEQQLAIKKVLNNIDLFKTIYNRVGKDVQDITTFRAILGDITHAEKSVIQNKAEQIRNVYIDLISNIDSDIVSDKKEPSHKPEEDNFFDMEEKDENNSNEEMIFVKADKIKLSLPLNDINIELVKNALNGMKKEKGKKKDE